MKKIYAADRIAAVILDSEDEIEVVALALATYVPAVGQLGGKGEIAAGLLAEITAPAPE